jgi:hypothetical protein
LQLGGIRRALKPWWKVKRCWRKRIAELPFVREARVFLYGLKAAAINSRRTTFEPIMQAQVTEYPLARQAKSLIIFGIIDPISGHYPRRVHPR